MADGISKLRLLIDIDNRLKGGLNSARDQVNKAVGGMQTKLSSFKASNIQMFDAIKSNIPGVEGTLGMIANPYTIATAAVVGLGAGIVKATSMANNWHEGMAKINVTAGLSKKELGGLSDKLLEIGGRNIAPLEEVPQAFNRIISSGLSVNQSLATLEPTLRAAKAGFADIETVAAAGVSVMQSSGQNANRVFDVLFATVNKGNAEFKDIAQYLPKIIPLARNVGFALDETAGAYASLTTKLSAEQSTTALQGIMRSLSNKDIVKNFKGIGVNVFDDKTGKVKPILNIIDQLSKKMAGLSDKQRMLKFGKIGLDQESMLGFSTLMQDMPNLKSAIDSCINSQGALNKAYADAKSPMDEWMEVSNKLKQQMIKIGELFLPVVSKIGAGVSSIIDVFTSNADPTTSWGKGLKGIVDILKTIAVWVQWPVLLIGYAIKGVVAWASKSEILKDVAGGIGTAFSAVWEVVKFIADKISWLWHHTIGPLLNKIEDAYKGIKGILGIKSEPEPFKMVDPRTITDSQIDAFSNHYGVNAATMKKNKNKLLDGMVKKGLWTKEEAYGPDIQKKDAKTDFSSMQADAKKISSGSQTKTTNIKIDSFIKELKPTEKSNINDFSRDQLESWLSEMFLRVIRSAELA
jgi:TP901 family phage tail tape measure protein